ncbi:potassium transporter TrkG [Thermodesulfobacteriota bacterium]
MNYASITNVLGKLLILTGCSMGLPLICSLYYNENDLIPIFISAMIIILIGLPLWWIFRKNHDLDMKDGFFLAVFGWILVSAVSGLPFMIHGSIPSFTDAFFEMMSGYTTSGATILTDIEMVPHGLLFWRSETHLLGGMGFLTLVVIFLPHGMGGASHIPGGVEPRPGDHQRKIQSQEQGHHDLALGDLSGPQSSGDVSVMFRRNGPL